MEPDDLQQKKNVAVGRMRATTTPIRVPFSMEEEEGSHNQNSDVDGTDEDDDRTTPLADRLCDAAQRGADLSIRCLVRRLLWRNLSIPETAPRLAAAQQHLLTAVYLQSLVDRAHDPAKQMALAREPLEDLRLVVPAGGATTGGVNCCVHRAAPEHPILCELMASGDTEGVRAYLNNTTTDHPLPSIDGALRFGAVIGDDTSLQLLWQRGARMTVPEVDQMLRVHVEHALSRPSTPPADQGGRRTMGGHLFSLLYLRALAVAESRRAQGLPAVASSPNAYVSLCRLRFVTHDEFQQGLVSQ